MITATYTFRDNNGRIAETRVRWSSFDTITSAEPAAFALLSAMNAITNAIIVEMTLYAEPFVGSDAPPEAESDVKRALLLFYRNGDDCASVRVPSPSLLLAETSGFYAGIRITRERLELLSLLSTVEAIPAGTVDAVGRPHGTAFTVGGVTRI